MCGRFTIYSKASVLKKRFKVTRIDTKLYENYNATPTQKLPVILNNDPKTITTISWGLVPFWAKDTKIGNKLINARAETVTEKPSFRTAFKKRRCLVLTNGYYEWKTSNGEKQPYYFTLKNNEPFAMAGLWEQWKNQERILQTFTILTTKANSLMEKYHHRMPVILKQKDEQLWLSSKATNAEHYKLLGPYPSLHMKATKVSMLVNNSKNKGLELIQKIK